MCVALCTCIDNVYDTVCVSVFEEPTGCVEYRVCVIASLRQLWHHFCATPGAFGSTL